MLKVYVKPGYETVDLGKVTIELKFLYDGKPLENTDSKCNFYWKSTNQVEKKLFDYLAKGDLNKINKIKEILGSAEKNQITGNVHNKAGKTILYAAADAYKKKKYTAVDYFDLISQLLNIPGIDVNNQCDGNTFSTKFFLEDQLRHAHVEHGVIALLLGKGAMVSEGSTKMNLCLKSLSGHSYIETIETQLAKLDFLLTKFPGEINGQDSDGNTPLHIAVLEVYEGNIQGIKKLKKKLQVGVLKINKEMIQQL